MTDAHLGPRAPVVVLVHGSRLSARQWEGYAALLPGIEVVTADLPGHGGRSGEEFTWEAALATVGEAVRHAGDRPVVLAGHSLGGYVALAWAARGDGGPGPAALVLIGATGQPRGVGALLYRGFARLAQVMGPQRMGRLTSAAMRGLGAPEAVAAELEDGRGYDTLPVVWQAVIGNVSAEMLGRVPCPVVVVNGQFDQMRTGVKSFLRHRPGARVVTLPRATHLAPLTHPEAVAAELRRTVDDVRASA